MKRNLILFSFAIFTWGLGEGFYGLFQPLYLQQLGADPIKIGSLLGLASMAAMLSFLPVGYLTDRFGQRPLLRITCLIGVLATLQMATTTSLTGFTLGLVLYGVSNCFSIPMSSFLTASRGKLSIARVLTLNTALYNLGSAIGSLFGGVLGDRFGLQMNFRAAIPILIISTVITFMVRPNDVAADKSAAAKLGIKALLHGGFPVYALLTFFIMFGMYLPQPLSQNFLQNERHVNLESIGQLIAARYVGIVILNLVLGHLNARIGMLISQACMALFAIFIWLGSGFPIYLAGYMLIGSFITARGLVIAQGRVLVNAANTSLAYGVLETVMSIAMVLAPPVAGAFYAIQPEWTYSIGFALIIIGIIASLLFSPIKRRDMVLFEEHK